MADPVFNIDGGLLQPTDLPRPNNIIELVESEAHDDAVVIQPPPIVPAPAGQVLRLVQAPDMHQHPPLDNGADLARALHDFQVAERILFGVANRRREIIHQPEAEDYMDLEDVENLEDFEDVEENLEDFEDVEARLEEGLEDVEDSEGSEDSSMEEPELPPPGDHPSPSISPDLQMQEAEHEVQSERCSAAEKPSGSWTLEFFIQVEEIGEVRYCDEDSVVHEAAVNGESVQDHQSLIGTDEAPLMKSDPDDPAPIIEETHTQELIQHVNPPSSGSSARTLAASPTLSSLIPGASDTLSRMCESSLESVNITSATAATENKLSEGESVPKPAAAAADGSISTDEAVQN